MTKSPELLNAKILIVDDLEANVLLLTRMLRGAGYEKVSSTTQPDEVCRLHLENQYDLILLDLEMPKMDGFAVMENLKEVETGGYLPVLVITAQPMHKMRALQAGARDFVSKPFEMAEVLLRVHNMLEVRLLHAETRRLYERVLAEQEVSQRLVLNVLPRSVAERLQARKDTAGQGPVVEGSVVDASTELVWEGYAEVTALFADIMEFTRFAEGASAAVLVGVLDDIRKRVGGSPATAGRRDLRTMEDAYLAVLGLPDGLADQTAQASQMALDLAKALDRFNAHGRYQLKVKIGLETREMAGGTLHRRTAETDL